ncbi:hypothetical protein F5Y15DRAFT_414543 [Xylariaceae sp. FL0016]|nr:hypothetical protein F5Y15DRAFT_414543 [Xylariaceae sp. FL0016]
MGFLHFTTRLLVSVSLAHASIITSNSPMATRSLHEERKPVTGQCGALIHIYVQTEGNGDMETLATVDVRGTDGGRIQGASRPNPTLVTRSFNSARGLTLTSKDLDRDLIIRLTPVSSFTTVVDVDAVFEYTFDTDPRPIIWNSTIDDITAPAFCQDTTEETSSAPSKRQFDPEDPSSALELRLSCFWSPCVGFAGSNVRPGASE